MWPSRAKSPFISVMFMPCFIVSNDKSFLALDLTLKRL